VTLHVAPQGIPTKRSYTIASSPTWRDQIEITVKREDQGLVSRWLHDELDIGDEVEIEAPNGTCRSANRSRTLNASSSG
jgi:ferredoxin-NADP reductase